MARSVTANPADQKTKELWNVVLDLEKKLRSTLRKKNFYDVEARSLRNELKKAYVELIFADLQFSQDQAIEPMLWKGVFYRTIEEFRNLVRTAANAGESGKQQHAKVVGAYLKYLSDSTKFYEDLIERFQEHAADPEQSVHRCLIYLGDLARYQAQALMSSPKADDRKDNTEAWKRASIYYKRAAAVLPSSGNPFNQLAVMAYYTSDELRAVYYYFRSLSVQSPFHTAKENLIMLFEKNRTKYNNLPSPSPHPSSADPLRPLFQDVSTRFVRLHGILYDRINAEQLSTVQDSAFASLTTLLNTPPAMAHLAHSPPQDQLLLHLAATLVFTTYQHHQKALAAADRRGPDRADELRAATTLAAQAASILLQYISTLATHFNPTHQPTLSALHILLYYLHSQPTLLLPTPTSPASYTSTYATMLLNLISVVHSLQTLPDPPSVNSDPPSAPLLPEEADLLGFQPLAIPNPPENPTPRPATQPTNVRASKLLTTLHNLHLTLTPPPPIPQPSLTQAIKSFNSVISAAAPPPSASPAKPTLRESAPNTQGRASLTQQQPPAASSIDEEEEEVIVFKPRSSRTSTAPTSPPESISALPSDLFTNDLPPHLPDHAHPPTSFAPPTLPLPTSVLPSAHPAAAPPSILVQPEPLPPLPSNPFFGASNSLGPFLHRSDSPQLSQPSRPNTIVPILTSTESSASWLQSSSSNPLLTDPPPTSQPTNPLTTQPASTSRPHPTWSSPLPTQSNHPPHNPHTSISPNPPFTIPTTSLPTASTHPPASQLLYPHPDTAQPPAPEPAYPPYSTSFLNGTAIQQPHLPSSFAPITNRASSLHDFGIIKRPGSAMSDHPHDPNPPVARHTPFEAPATDPMSVDLPSGSEALRRLLGVGGTGPSAPGAGRSPPLPASGPTHPIQQPSPPHQQHPPQAAADSTSMFGALFGAPDVFQTVRQNSGGAPQAGGGGLPMPLDAPSAPSSIMSGISCPASRTDTPIDPALLDPAILSSSGAGGPLHHLHMSLKAGGGHTGLPPGLPLQGGNLQLQSAAARASAQQLPPPQVQVQQQHPGAPGAEPFSFLELLQEQQEQHQQEQQQYQQQGAGGYSWQQGTAQQQAAGGYGVHQGLGQVQQPQLYGNGLHMQQDLPGLGAQGYPGQAAYGAQGAVYGAGGVGYGMQHLLPGAQH